MNLPELIQHIRNSAEGVFVKSQVFSYMCDRKLRTGFGDARPSIKIISDEDKVKTIEHETQDSSGLTIRFQVRCFSQFQACDWVIQIQNNGSEDSPILSDVFPLDFTLELTEDEHSTYQSLKGDSCDCESFMPIHNEIKTGDSLRITAEKGRSSSAGFPFFNLKLSDGGIIVAVGWSGQWLISLERSKCSITIKAGMEHLNLYLRPGESIRTPRILIMPWIGDLRNSHNDFRKLMRWHYSPKPNGELPQLPIALQNFDRYVWCKPEWSTEEGQLTNIDKASKCECFDTYWLDAAWFPKGFPDGVGNLFVRQEFPKGLKPISDKVHENGMRFMLWFEPERVVEGTQIYESHKEWLLSLPDANYHIFNLGNSEARTWLTAYISEFITENNIDIYRQDFNIDPLPYWLNNDEDNRVGITEIRYIEGLYAFWDSLLKEHPSLLVDNCSSGGRRIDLETCSRSVPLWRSDTGCSPSPEMSDLKQNQTIGLSQYLPYHATSTWTVDAYSVRSGATMGVAANFHVLDERFPFEQAKHALDEVRRLQLYWDGDFYPLTNATLDSRHWVAYQLDDRIHDSGMVMFFRRKDSPYTSASFKLFGVIDDRIYKLKIIDETRQLQTKTISGKELRTDFRIEIPSNKNSLLIEYSSCISC